MSVQTQLHEQPSSSRILSDDEYKMMNSDSNNASNNNDAEDSLLGNANLCVINLGHELIRSHSIQN